MNDERQIVRTDLTILEEMVVEVERCLMNDTIRSPLAKSETSELSIEKPNHFKARATYVML